MKKTPPGLIIDGDAEEEAAGNILGNLLAASVLGQQPEEETAPALDDPDIIEGELVGEEDEPRALEEGS